MNQRAKDTASKMRKRYERLYNSAIRWGFTQTNPIAGPVPVRGRAYNASEQLIS